MTFLNKNKRLLTVILIGLMFLGLFINHKYRAPKRNYADFHCFYTTGKRILEHKNIYVLRDQEAAEFRYTPVFAVLMSGFALMNKDSADTAWFVFNFILTVLVFIYLKKLVIIEKTSRKKEIFWYLALIFGVITFILRNFNGGQTNILMMACIVCGLYLIENNRECLGALLLAFSIMIKYTPAVFVPYFLLRKRFKLSLAIVISVLFYLLLPSVIIGFKTNLAYLINLYHYLVTSTIFDQMTILDPQNQSLFSMVTRYFTNCVYYFYAPPMPFQSISLSAGKIKTIFIALSALLYLSILYAPKRKRACNSFRASNIDYSLLAICVALYNLNSWRQTYVLIIMGLGVALYYLLKSGFKDIAVAMLLALSYVINAIAMYSIFGKSITYKLSFYSPVTISSLLIFLALLKIKFFAVENRETHRPSPLALNKLLNALRNLLTG